MGQMLKTVKTGKDIVLDGVTVELEKTDASITAVTLTDAAGHRLIIRKTDWAFGVFVPSPPKMVKKFRVSGELKGIKFSEDKESEFEATQRLVELGLENDPMTAKIEQVEVADDSEAA